MNRCISFHVTSTGVGINHHRIVTLIGLCNIQDGLVLSLLAVIIRTCPAVIEIRGVARRRDPQIDVTAFAYGEIVWNSYDGNGRRRNGQMQRICARTTVLIVVLVNVCSRMVVNDIMPSSIVTDRARFRIVSALMDRKMEGHCTVATALAREMLQIVAGFCIYAIMPHVTLALGHAEGTRHRLSPSVGNHHGVGFKTGIGIGGHPRPGMVTVVHRFLLRTQRHLGISITFVRHGEIAYLRLIRGDITNRRKILVSQ